MPVIRKEISDYQFIVERDTILGFPTIGKHSTLYIDKSKDEVYRYESGIYIKLKSNDWKEIKKIDGGTP